MRYDNVPVFVNYSNARYEPFRVNRIVDVGDDAQFGERKVLLDGVTPAWGVWNESPSGERQFEVHRTQQFPGLEATRTRVRCRVTTDCGWRPTTRRPAACPAGTSS